MQHKNHARIFSLINLLAGLYLLATPFIFNFSGGSAEMNNNIIVGALIAFFALVRLSMPEQATGLSWVNAALGAWTIVSAFAFNYAFLNIQLNNLITGLIVVLSGSRSAVETGLMRRKYMVQ